MLCGASVRLSSEYHSLFWSIWVHRKSITVMEPKVVLEADEFDRIVELRGTCLNDQAERNTLLVY
jgi:hypothetical protein